MKVSKSNEKRLCISTVVVGGGHGKRLNVYPLQLLRFRNLLFRQPHTQTQLIPLFFPLFFRKQNDGYAPPFTLPDRLHHIQMCIEFIDRIVVHRLEHVCVCIERNVYVCMAKPGLKNYRRNA